jgi:hypothetical protein
MVTVIQPPLSRTLDGTAAETLHAQASVNRLALLRSNPFDSGRRPYNHANRASLPTRGPTKLTPRSSTAVSTVCRSRHTRLTRNVTLKVLPDSFAGHTE